MLTSTDLRFRYAEPDIYYAIAAKVEELGVRGGLYRVHAGGQTTSSGPEEIFAAVPRLLRADSLGRLYIGKAEDFTSRFMCLWKGLLPGYKDSGHDFASRYLEHPSTIAAYPPERLTFSLRFDRNPRAAESDELADYLRNFGELPPFNHQG